MSRHRGVRGLENTYHEDDYGSSYGSSYCDEISLSTSVEEQYMFRRHASGTTPRMGHFLGRTTSVDSVPEEDEGRGRPGADDEPDSDDDSFASSPHQGRRHSSCGSMIEGLSEEDQIKLAHCLETILDVVGDAKSEAHIKETILRCDFDTELALNTLLNNPSGPTSQAPRSRAIPVADTDRRRPLEPQPTPWSPPAASATAMPPVVVPLPEASGVSEVFLPDPNPSPLANGQAAALPKPFVPPAVAAVKKANRLDIRSRSPSPNVAANTSAASVPGSAVKMRKGKIDPVEIYAKERGGKDHQAKDLLNLVVVGHVDSGKSTLMGHLLVDLGQVSSRVMHKYENESKKIGKSSFAYAWVLDETSEERERGITMDVGHSSFETDTKSVTLLDAPGHRDFIPNMISGAYQADVAVLVVNATRGEFEAGFDAGGQTREHALLVRSLGVSQLIVAVNKLDTVDWSQSRFQEIVEKLGKFLKGQVGFKDPDLTFVPVSGLTGANLAKKDAIERTNDTEWFFNTPTLIQAVDNFKSPPRSIEKAFRMSISDVFKPTSGGASGGFCLAGRIETGYIQKNDSVLIAPLNEILTVKAVSLDNSSSNSGNNAFAGDHVSLTVSGVDQMNVCQGMILCDPSNPVKVSRHFAAKIVVLNVDMPVTKGFSCVLHHAGVQESAILKKLVAQLSKSTGEVTKKKPRVLNKNASAVVEIQTENTICLEKYSESKELGRFMLRVGGKTIAAGMVTDIF